MEIQKNDNFWEILQINTLIENNNEFKKIVKWIKIELYQEYDFYFIFEEFKKFCSYWTEEDKKGKERWQVEKFFSVNKRFSRWLINAKRYSLNKKYIWNKKDYSIFTI